MKPRSRVSVLLALVLLALPGSAWAQVALSGKVTFSDGTPAAGAWVVANAFNAGTIQSAAVDASGSYVLYLFADTYSLNVQFEGSGFSGSQRLVTSLPLTTSTQLDLTVSDIQLNGRIVDSSGQPVPNARLYGYTSAQSNWGNLSTTAGADGRFQVRMLPGTYGSLQLVPPAGSSYATTSLPTETFSSSTTKDFVLNSGIRLSGKVTFSDGTPAAGAWVVANAFNAGTIQSAAVDASGSYVLYLFADTYSLNVQFEGSGFSGSQRLVTSLPLSSNTQMNLSVGDIQLNSRIVDSSGQPVPNARLYGYTSAQSNWGNLSTTAGADGRFQVRMLPGTYGSLQLVPPAGSSYATTSLPTETFSSSTTKDFVLNSGIRLSGKVTFSDGTPAAGAWVVANAFNAGTIQSAAVDASGSYVLYLFADTYSLNVQFEGSGFSGSQRLVTSLPLSSNTQMNLSVGDIQLNGRIVDSSGQPVPNARLYGYTSAQSNWGNLSTTAGADGRFQVRMLPGTYGSMQLQPATSSGYLTTPLPDETLTASVSKEYVLLDLDECQYNHGGCSENATCTNTPGSRTCTCKPGYSGDGITCTGIPGRVIINEILANEPGSATAGEFVELLNVGAAPVDISGWRLWDATATRHTFAAGTVLAPGKALVVFGSASGIPSGLSNAVGASTGGLNLANTTDTVTVKNASGSSIDTFTYSSSLAASDGVSMNRSPDASAGAGFVLHNSLSSLSASAGKRVNGTAF